MKESEKTTISVPDKILNEVKEKRKTEDEPNYKVIRRLLSGKEKG